MSFLFIIAIAVVGWLVYSLHLKKILAQGKTGQIKLILIFLGLVFLLMAVTGKAHALFAIIGAALTQVMRLAPLLIRYAPFLKRHMGGNSTASSDYGSTDQVSEVATATIIMTLDHKTGGMDGRVLAGDCSGRTLSSLKLQELQTLHSYCQAQDAEACRLLDTYVQRERASEWQQAGNDSTNEQANYPSQGKMDTNEAMQVLGITGELTRDTVIAAHRTLMGRFHPDKGGNNYIATKLNEARAVLLDNIG